MDDLELKTLFRSAEVMNRQRRRLALLQSEAKLTDEPLSEKDREAHSRALASIIEQERSYQAELDKERGGYWTRLWRAVLGRY